MASFKCHQSKKGSLKWEGSLESLQSFLDSLLNTDTKWSTPRGGCKQYEIETQVEIRWYASRKSICISRPASESLKAKLTAIAQNQH